MLSDADIDALTSQEAYQAGWNDAVKVLASRRLTGDESADWREELIRTFRERIAELEHEAGLVKPFPSVF
jgi:hypothetical protein